MTRFSHLGGQHVWYELEVTGQVNQDLGGLQAYPGALAVQEVVQFLDDAGVVVVVVLHHREVGQGL